MFKRKNLIEFSSQSNEPNQSGDMEKGRHRHKQGFCNWPVLHFISKDILFTRMPYKA